MLKKGIIVIFFILFAQSCSSKPGIFAFFPVDMSVLTAEQKIWFQPSDFRRFRDPIYFEKHHTVWYAYKPDSPKHGKTYAISLLKKSLGYIEVDIRNQALKKSTDYLVDRYDNLETGFYKLKIAVDNKVIDFVNFEIVESADKHVINYELSVDDSENTENNEDYDDIRALSD
ncbi:MAG: hypothetical protein OEZ13_04215 [Spirochaetia bacterium]|nr:hypothetical protein [Spirochaetia bacterium]